MCSQSFDGNHVPERGKDMARLVLTSTSGYGLGSGKVDKLREVPDPGFINFPDIISSTNVILEYMNNEKPIPPAIKQWQPVQDFHLARFKIRLESDPKYRGAEEFRLSVELVTGEGEDTMPPQIDDAGPDSEWINAAYSGDLSLKIDTGFVGDILKLIPQVKEAPPLPEISGSIKYTWNPKVAKVKAGAAGRSAQWVLYRHQGEYLDGDHELLLLIRRPREIKSLFLEVYSAWARYDKTYWPEDTAFTKREILRIPIKFIVSPTGVQITAL